MPALVIGALGLASILPEVLAACLETGERKEKGVDAVTVGVGSKRVFVNAGAVVWDDEEGFWIDVAVVAGKEKLGETISEVDKGAFGRIAGVSVFPPNEKVGAVRFVLPNCTEGVVFDVVCDTVGPVFLLAMIPPELLLNNGIALEAVLIDVVVPDGNTDVETLNGFISKAVDGCLVLLKLSPPLRGTVGEVDVDFPLLLGITDVEKIGFSFGVDLIDTF